LNEIINLRHPLVRLAKLGSYAPNGNGPAKCCSKTPTEQSDVPRAFLAFRDSRFGRFVIPSTARFAVGERTMSQPRDDTYWVCETHDDRPWSGDKACGVRRGRYAVSVLQCF
jgi:hypothetical protein